jgi:hypothetical protein
VPCSRARRRASLPAEPNRKEPAELTFKYKSFPFVSTQGEHTILFQTIPSFDFVPQSSS